MKKTYSRREFIKAATGTAAFYAFGGGKLFGQKQDGKNEGLSLKIRLSVASIFAEASQDLANYYGPDRQKAGIKPFMDWFSKSDKDQKLQIAYYDFLVGRHIIASNTTDLQDTKKSAFHTGIWVGGQYLLEAFPGYAYHRIPYHRIQSENEHGGSVMITKTGNAVLNISADVKKDVGEHTGEIECFLVGVHTGIHEYTHLLHFLTAEKQPTGSLEKQFEDLRKYLAPGTKTGEVLPDGMGYSILPEGMAGLTQHRLAPPMKDEHILSMPLPRRDIRNLAKHLKKERFKEVNYICAEYMACAIVPWLNAYVTSPAQMVKMRVPIGINDMYPMVKLGQLFYEGTGKNPPNYDIWKEAMYTSIGLREGPLMAKIDAAMYEIQAQRWDSMEQFLNIFITSMDQHLGKPKLDTMAGYS